MTPLLLWLVGIYRRFVSPLTGSSCRFEPSCSRYAELCWKYHSPGRGSWLVCKRLLRCHPLCRGGIDLPPLPEHADPADREPDYERLAAKLDRLTAWRPAQTPKPQPRSTPSDRCPDLAFDCSTPARSGPGHHPPEA